MPESSFSGVRVAKATVPWIQASMWNGVPVYLPADAAGPDYTVLWQRRMCVNNLPKVALSCKVSNNLSDEK